ncbi:MAG: trypsin-like peptidase domain-containing protein [Candidatus Scalindua sp.]|jgi:tetratricopeptide (TPR) repeat protein|nr:trypsin-like peptidase domain-containing protein [Candidatus Scalindua sp.]MDV5166985.1 trypsin-like peptidase domain-containing protein [Candidatus Scalindua sp.]
MKIRNFKSKIVLFFFLLVPALIHSRVAGADYEYTNEGISSNLKTDAIVDILTFKKGSNRYHATTGFIVSPDGIIITNYHTLVNINSIEIRLTSEKKLKFEGILGVDRQKDIAVLKVKGNNLPCLKIGDPKTLHTNNFVEAFGCSSKKCIENGSKTGNRKRKLLRKGGYIFTIKPLFDHSYDMIYSTNQVTLGFSGGPVIDVNGDVIGIVSRLLHIHDYADSVICFSVPINYTAPLLKNIQLQSLEEFIAVDKDNKEWWLIAGSTKYLKERKEWDAERYITKAIEIDPGYAEAYGTLGTIRIKQGRYDDAINLLNRASAISPETFFFHKNLGHAYKEKKMWNKAILAYEKNLPSFPMLGPIYMHLAILYEKTGNTKISLKCIDKSIVAYQKELTYYHEPTSIYLRLATLFEKRGDTDRALQYVNKVIQAKYDVGREYFLRANIYVKKALRLDTEKRDVDKGFLVNAMHDYEKAADLARKNIVIFDPAPLIYALKKFIGEGELTGDPEVNLTQNYDEYFAWDTEEQLSYKIDLIWKMIKREKDKHKRRNLYSFFTANICRWSINLYVKGKYDKVVAITKMAIKLNKNNAESFLLLRAKAHGHLHKWNKTVEDCNRALDLDPDCASAFYIKGVGYKNLDNLVEADKAFANYKRLRSKPQINIKYN